MVSVMTHEMPIKHLSQCLTQRGTQWLSTIIRHLVTKLIFLQQVFNEIQLYTRPSVLCQSEIGKTDTSGSDGTHHVVRNILLSMSLHKSDQRLSIARNMKFKFFVWNPKHSTITPSYHPLNPLMQTMSSIKLNFLCLCHSSLYQ